MSDGALHFQLDRLQGKVDKLDVGHGQQAITLAEHEVKITDVQASVGKLADTVNKAIWVLVGFAFTVAGSALLLAFTVAS